MAKLLIPYTNFITPSGFYEEQPEDIVYLFRVGDQSNTLVKRFTDVSGTSSGIILGQEPGVYGMSVRAAIDNDPDNSFMCIANGTNVFWNFDESLLNDFPRLKAKQRAIYIKS